MRSKFKWIFALLLAFSVQFTFAQEKTVTGTVKGSDGMSLPAANVIVKGTTRATQTDFDGNYSIKVSQGESLVFSYTGYVSQTIVVGATSKIDVTLSETQLETVVINTGYKSFTKRDNPSAIATISIESIEDRANASVIQNLQGQIAGLNVATGSGQPGSDSTIILRGVGSINGNIEPLFIVDGSPVDEDGFRSINQNDIATISVLKDASATSIYGNRGGNGVIVITTKRGKLNEKMKFRYSSQYGINELQGLNIELMNSRQMLKLEQQYGGGLGGGLSDAEIDVRAKQANTNWADIFFRKGTTQTHDLSITSGSEKTSNFTSLSYFDQEGIFINTNFKRFSVRNNFTGRSENNKFNYSFNFSANFSRSNGIDGAGTNAIFFAPFSAALRGLPYLSPYDADGSITRDGGIAPGDASAVTANAIPYVLLNSAMMNTDVEDEFKMVSALNATYNFAKNLTAGIQIGIDYSTFTTKEVLDPRSILGPFQVSQAATFGGIQSEGSTRDFRFNTTANLNYNNTFGKHSIDVTAYTEYNKAHYDGINFQVRGLDARLLGTGAAFVDFNTIELGGEIYTPTIGSFKLQEGLFSYFGNMQYEYDNKYVLSGTLRRDASFRFVDDNKWGTFWSVGGAWSIDQESFMKDKTALNLLKLRASYGTSGNQRIINAQYSGLNLTRSLYGQGGGYDSGNATFATQIGNVDLQWEELKQSNIGLDFGIWKNKLSGSFDVYVKTTEQLFQDRPVSPITGTSILRANIGSLENRGIEAELKYVVYDKNGWNIGVNANASYNKNKILELADSFEGIQFQGGASALIEGEPVDVFYIQRYAGVNPANGNALFLDAEGNLTEQISDASRVSTGKSIYPVWQGGFGTNISYKGFELASQWSWMAKLWRNNLDLGTVEETNTVIDGGNRSTTVLNAWQNPGDITTIPRVGNPLNSIDYINGTDRYLEDASFLRLRNVSLGYTFGSKSLEKTPFSGVKFFVQAENIVTFSSYRGWDAEAGFRSTDRGNYPTPKIYTFGATINF
ncbi:MAG: SusC/RagA family TonB-linked outer membrane protein [Flavobacterium sp. BFFFF1]|uniref:SusC/RagA family TonB-linked outer membrane protein n=1 Tax=unclassified Flavobacterium TaxID=196869 RepID=UPI000BC6C102|nr:MULTISPECIES: TonB-dependent receptor [unclassified Flavobacterium]OYU81622.1 MAG: SusC/RagA family TonB-linked outer membrane protein [Flavobacterium sp. BFFFF1]